MRSPSDVDQGEIDEEAQIALEAVNNQSITENREFGGLIILNENGDLQTIYGDPGSKCIAGMDCALNIGAAFDRLPEGSSIIAAFHTHGAAPPWNSEMFSSFSMGDLLTLSAFADQYSGFQSGHLGVPQGRHIRVTVSSSPAFISEDVFVGELPR